MITVHPKFKCVYCNGNLYEEEGELACLLCGRPAKHIKIKRPAK